jgi:hypothetical protein
MRKKHFILYAAIGAVVLLFSCTEKQTPSTITTIPLKDYQQTRDAKDIFRLSDYNNTSTWVVPDGKGDLKIKLGKQDKSRYLWTNTGPIAFQMEGGAENTVRIDIPPIGEATSMDVPFSFEVPWSLSTNAVPDTYKRLLKIGLYQSGEFNYSFGEDVPFFGMAPDIRLILPSCISPEPDDHNVLPEQNGYQFYIWYYGPLSEPVSMIASFDVPEDYQSIPDHTIRMDSNLTISGTLHLEKKRLKEGREWPDHLDLSFEFTHEGPLSQATGQFNFPSEYTLPDISFQDDLQIRPMLFQGSYPNIHLYDTRVRLDFLNRSPFHVRLLGKVASYKNGEVLHSIPFGEDRPIEAIPFDAVSTQWSYDDLCEKTVILSEFDRFPVTFPPSDFPDYQEHLSLQANGLSSLFIGDPDDIRFTDLRVQRDPEEIIDLTINDFEMANYKLGGQVITPLQAANDFTAQTSFPIFFPRDLFEGDTPVHKATLEGTLTSTLPFRIEVKEIIGNEGIAFTWDKVILSPSLAKEASSAHFTLRFESEKDLKELWFEAVLLLRLTADESCAGKPINESDCISLTDVVVKY